MNWVFEISSGCDGYRCTKCKTWVHADWEKKCECTKEDKPMKTYFEYKGYKVQDYKHKSFANYKVTGANHCFNELNEAICYCIGIADGKASNNDLLIYVDTFITMITKEDKA